jgi:hypothetical protein
MMGAIRRAAGGMGLTDGAYDKIIAKVADPAFPLRLLAPYRSSSDDGYQAYLAELTMRFPSWLPVAVDSTEPRRVPSSLAGEG